MLLESWARLIAQQSKTLSTPEHRQLESTRLVSTFANTISDWLTSVDRRPSEENGYIASRTLQRSCLLLRFQRLISFWMKNRQGWVFLEFGIIVCPFQNALDDSVELFNQMYNNEFLRKCSFILFLNKKDILEHKVEHVEFSKFFPSYKGIIPRTLP
jgi:hypothetical protein